MELLERQAELDELRRRPRDAEGGCGKVMFVAGEAGAGKSSLVEAFAAAQRGMRTIWSGCQSLQTPRAFGPVHEIAATLAIDSLAVGHAEHSRPQLFARIVDALSLPNRVTALVMEDLHWADEATLDFVRYLGRRIQRTRCLLIVTFRIGRSPRIRSARAESRARALPPDAPKPPGTAAIWRS